MKSTKRALLTSGLCLMLTALMLVGSTFAWFTDSVVNEGNVIQTGKLDVRATGYRWDEGTNSWTVLHNLRETLITERDWEPGISNVAVVRASNLNSSLAAKVKMQITVVDNQNNLADAIWVHITPIVTAKGNISSVVDVDNLSYARQNILMENENVVSMSRVGEISGLEVTLGHEQEFDNNLYVYYVIEYGMYADAGSQFQGGSIEMQIGVTATQASVESETDGFGNNDYDADAEYAVSATNENFAETIRNATPGTTVLLTEDVHTSTIPVPAGEVTLDLNGHTLRVSNQTTLSGGQKLTLKNGSFIRQGDYNWNSLDFAVIGGASMELDGVTYTGAGFQPQGQGSTVRIANSTVVSKTYCVSTNASASANHGVKVEIEKSTLKCTDADSAAILFNVPGTLTVKDSTLEGGRQALIVRGGTAELSGCELTNRAEYTNTKQYYDSSWGSGNEVPMAGLVVGNRANAYQYAATCTLTDTTITVAGTEVPDIYIYGNAEEGLGATLTYPSGTDYEIVKGGNATIIQN